MLSFVLKINPEIREELYSDVALEFLDLIFLEAVFILFQMANPYDYPLVDDISFLEEDPDSQFEASVEYLLSVLAEKNPLDGVLQVVQDPDGQAYSVPDPGYDDAIRVKLGEAVDTFRMFNDQAELTAIKSVLAQANFKQRFKFTSVHLAGPSQVMFMIQPGVDQLGMPSIGSIPLMNPDLKFPF